MKINIFNFIVSLLLVVISISLLWDILLNDKNSSKIDALLNTIDKQSVVIDSIHLKNKRLQQDLVGYHTFLDSISNRIDSTNQELNLLNTKTNEKLNSIKYYSVDELERYFTERYTNRLNNND